MTNTRITHTPTRCNTLETYIAPPSTVFVNRKGGPFVGRKGGHSGALTSCRGPTADWLEMIRDSRQPVEAHFHVVSDFRRKIYDSPSAHPRESVALRRFHESRRRTRIFPPSSALRRTPNPLPSQGCCWMPKTTLRGYPIEVQRPRPRFPRRYRDHPSHRNPRKGNACASELSRTDRGLARDDS